MIRSRSTAVLVLALLGALAAGLWGTWTWSLGQALDRLSLRAEAQLSLAADRLDARLQAFRQLAVLMARQPSLRVSVQEETDQVLDEAARVLRQTADMTGAAALHVLNRDGRAVVSSAGLPGQWAEPVLIDGGAFRRAMQGALGAGHGRTSQGTRAFYFAAPIQNRGAPPRGALMVVVDPEGIETDWRGDPVTILFSDDAGTVFLSNRSELLSAGGPAFTARRVAGHELRRPLAAGEALPDEALWATRPLPRVGMTAELWMDTAPARATAARVTALAGAGMIVLLAVMFALYERRASLARALQAEERLNADLEARVAARTAELSALNRDLRREVRERQEAEEALRRTQADLVQAGKLSALGKMSAGISHELNQPLTAISNFADNARAFLERGQPEKAADNLGRISDLAARMGRIIRNLRAFARNESEPVGQVDLVAVIRAALELSDPSIRRAGVDLRLDLPDHPVMVEGGEVRLQQVLVNLIGNALDAMSSTPAPVLAISTREAEGAVEVIVHDNGPGLEEPDKVFEPFYTTKEVGAANGMGLGLSISYGIVQSFGGRITGTNRPEGGAEFRVSLTPVAGQAAA